MRSGVGGSIAIGNAILKELPIASKAVVTGEGREYLTCLITLKVCDQSHAILKIVLDTNDNTAMGT